MSVPDRQKWIADIGWKPVDGIKALREREPEWDAILAAYYASLPSHVGLGDYLAAHPIPGVSVALAPDGSIVAVGYQGDPDALLAECQAWCDTNEEATRDKAAVSTQRAERRKDLIEQIRVDHNNFDTLTAAQRAAAQKRMLELTLLREEA